MFKTANRSLSFIELEIIYPFRHYMCEKLNISIALEKIFDLKTVEQYKNNNGMK